MPDQDGLPTTSLERVVLDRVQSEVRQLGYGLELSETVLAAIRKALELPELTHSEQRVLLRTRGRPGTDVVAAVLARRVRSAIAAGTKAALGEVSVDIALESPSVVLIRRAEDESREGDSTELSAALDRIRAVLGAPGLLVLAENDAFEALRNRLFEELDDDKKTSVVFRPDGRGREVPGLQTPPVEVVRIEDPTSEHEDRLIAMLKRAEELDTPEGWEAEEGADPMLGTLFHAKYRILRKIGTGGFGSVYEARDERGAGNPVAIKILHPDRGAGHQQLRAFREEARRVTLLNHPNIVDWKVFDETEDGVSYFVMELLKGEELDRILAREAPLSADRSAWILLGVLDALRAAHHLTEGRSILHLDLKPRNVFIVPPREGGKEQIKVFDFGIGQYIGGDEEPLPAPGAPPTVQPQEFKFDYNPATITFTLPFDAGTTYSVLRDVDTEIHTDGRGTPFHRVTSCTPEYASPEQCTHMLGVGMVPLDGRSDIYSLGVMGYQMLTGDYPFDRPVVRADLLRKHTEERMKKVGEADVKVPKNLARFLDRCLERDRDTRWANAQEAFEALDRIVHPPVWRRVAPILAPIAAVLLALIAWLGYEAFTKVDLDPLALSWWSEQEQKNVDLQRVPLYMGPERRIVRLELREETSRALPSVGTRIDLVPSRDDLSLDGWHAAWIEDGVMITVEDRVDLPGSFRDHVELSVEEAGFQPTNLELIWLGRDAWSVDSVQVGDTPVSDLGQRKVDPQGQDLGIWVSGKGREYLSEVSVSVAGGRPVRMRASSTPGERVEYRVSLEGLLPKERSMGEGEALDLELEITDKAGRTKPRSESLLLAVGGVVTTATRRLVDTSRERECNRVSGSYLLTPETEPALTLEFNRPVDVEWWIEIDEQKKKRGRMEGRSSFVIPLETDFGTWGPHTGSIRFEARDEKYVLHGRGAESGVYENSIPYGYTEEQALFMVLLGEAVGTGRSRVDAARPVYTNELTPPLFVRRKGGSVPMTVVVRWSEKGLEGSEKDVVFDELQNPGLQEFSLPLALHRDGVYEVHVSSFQLASSTNGIPDQDTSFELIVDTVPPEITLKGLEEGGEFTNPEQSSISLEVELLEGKGESAGASSPVDIAWKLERKEGKTKRSYAGHPEIVDVGTPIPIELPLPWAAENGQEPDGEYQFVLTAEDHAGNKAASIRRSITAAVRGPVLVQSSPAEGEPWWADSETDQWTWEVKLEDPNGVRAIEAALVRKDNDGQPLPIPMSLGEGAGGSMVTAVGSIDVPHSYSEVSGRLRMQATDQHGTSSTKYIDVRLPRILPPSPDWILLPDDLPASTRMRLILGTAKAPYVFGGRNDSTENRDFREAGLANEYLFNPDPEHSRPRAWAVGMDEGTIPDFYLDEHEVTRRQFLEFLAAGERGYLDPRLWPPGSEGPDPSRSETLRIALSTGSLAGDPDLPMTSVTWSEASAYARYVGKRLPSWVEWEYAVRGGSRMRPYACYDPDQGPPSEDELRDRINVAWDPFAGDGGPWPAGNGRDRTPDTGLHDLTGNVAEWTSTPVWEEGEDRAEMLEPSRAGDWQGRPEFWIAGASFATHRFDFSVADARPRGHESSAVGFRCALSLKGYHDQLTTPPSASR